MQRQMAKAGPDVHSSVKDLSSLGNRTVWHCASRAPRAALRPSFPRHRTSLMLPSYGRQQHLRLHIGKLSSSTINLRSCLVCFLATSVQRCVFQFGQAWRILIEAEVLLAAAMQDRSTQAAPKNKAAESERRYLAVFLHRHLDFRRAEIEALAELTGAGRLHWEQPIRQPLSPFWYVWLPDDAAAQRIAERALLLKVRSAF